MSKNIFLLPILTLAFSILTTLPALATDAPITTPITVSGDEDPSTGSGEVYNSDSGTSNTTSETSGESTEAEPSENCDSTNDGNCKRDPEQRYDSEILDNGLANEPEVVCATGNEPGCDTAPNSELKPLYISLAALGATILLVILINLISRRRNRKRNKSESETEL